MMKKKKSNRCRKSGARANGGGKKTPSPARENRNVTAGKSTPMLRTVEYTMNGKKNGGVGFYEALRFGQVVGTIAFFLGFVLCIVGLTGVVEFLVEAGGIKAKIANASPGVMFAMLGFLILWRYRPKKSRTVTETMESVLPEVIAGGAKPLCNWKQKAEVHNHPVTTKMESLAGGAKPLCDSEKKAMPNEAEGKSILAWSESVENAPSNTSSLISYKHTESADSAMLTQRQDL